MPSFLLIVTGYNCAQYVEGCYKSIADQTGDWRAVFISDGSSDDTGEKIKTINDTRVIRKMFPDNMGAAKRRYDAIHMYAHPDDIVLLLGMDDELRPGCLDRISKEYESGKWMTYGNWIDQSGQGLPKDFDLFFDQQTHDNNSYRAVKYRSTAPNTFYAWLFKLIPEEDFKIDGKWITSTTESEAMFSCLEMSGPDRIGVIEDYIYLYRKNLPNGTLKRLGTEFKYKIYDVIIQRPRKQKLERRP